MKVYVLYINPTNNEDLWSEVNDGTRVIPPLIGRRKRGRKTTTRRKATEEIKNALRHQNPILNLLGKANRKYVGRGYAQLNVAHAMQQATTRGIMRK